MTYQIYPTRSNDVPDINWNHPFWQQAETLEIANFRPEGSSHRPRTRAKLLYSTEGIHGIFCVDDQYVRSVGTQYLDPVYRDSCVEFFVHPKQDQGYFNFEFNCGGAMLATQVINPERNAAGRVSETKKFPEEIWRLVEIQTSMPGPIPEEITTPVTWTLRFFIPFRVMEFFVGPIGNVKGQTWRANFQKCANGSSHPHWVSWAPLDKLDFHRPHCFGEIQFVS